MKRLRICGLVALAKRVRQELAGPISPERLVQLRQEVQDAVGAIEQILKDKRIGARNLPSPSRKALAFLQGVNWDSIVPQASSSGSRFPPESVSFRGLPRHFDHLLIHLARSVDDPQVQEVYETIVSDSANIEEQVRAQNIRPEQLNKQARELRGWFAYFSQRENFDRYCAAVRRAEPVFRAACPWPTVRDPSPVARVTGHGAQGTGHEARSTSPVAVLVRLRPMHGMYRVRGYPDRILVDLPTPMICFDQTTLRAVAQIAFRQGGAPNAKFRVGDPGGDRQAVHDAMAGEAYRRIDAAIELLGGVVAQMRGLHHDLAGSFERVNAEYFDRAMRRPRLVWSRSFAVRKFGHYDHARDTVVVNAALDREAVPAFVVDFIVYHELLHRQLGLTWKNNRSAAHTPELAQRERQFQHYDEAKAVLRKLASER
jgi:hypothetical protein